MNKLSDIKQRLDKTPYLTCIVSLKKRPSNEAYLNDKANRLGISVAEYKKFYICREVITQLKQGKKIMDLCKDVNAFKKLLLEKSLEDIIILNS